MSDEGTPPRGRLREHVAEEIRVLLARKRMSAAELARRTGIKQSTISRRMTGETAFDMDDLEVIAEVLEVEVGDLMPKTVKTGGSLNHNFEAVVRSDDVPAARHQAARPIGGGRRDATRPASPIRPSTRRPAAGRPGDRPRVL